MASLFFSYCHVDERLRDQLEVHLAMLKRDGLIETWHDRRIVAGSNLDETISEQLEQADVILLLVSADFIASDYCYSNEMGRALERQNSGEARVIPVILRACDWHGAPFGKLLAAPTDARPVTSWPNQDEAFTDVAKAIRKAITSVRSDNTPVPVANSRPTKPTTSAGAIANQLPRSSNLRVRKEFSDFDRDTFVADAFNFMARYFEGSLQALEERHPEFKGRFERIDSRRFVASVYKSGKAITQCTVALGGYGHGSTQITYADGITSQVNGYNEALMVGENSLTLFLKPMMNMMGGTTKDQLSESGAAEYYWSRFIERIQ